jgi:isoleucyl-tRNA synthetase
MQRSAAGIKIRQPLASLKIKHEGALPNYWDEVKSIVADEVNVKQVHIDASLATDVELDLTITDGLKEEGDLRDLIREVQDLRKQANLSPKDQAVLTVPAERVAFVEKHWAALSKATGLKGHEIGSDLAISK